MCRRPRGGGNGQGSRGDYSRSPGRPPGLSDTTATDYAYTIDHAGRRYFFRADDGRIEDDYMLAEGAVMQRLRPAGVPVPEVLAVDVSKRLCPFRYQILEWYREPCLNLFCQDGTLDRVRVGRQLGEYLAMMHSMSGPGFGFVDTEALAARDDLRGIDGSHRAYFLKCLDVHLAYLQDHELLSPRRVREIEERIMALAPLTELAEGAIVHRDVAFWNLLGERDRITAIIDWDGVVIGDPADDFGILGCFYASDVLDPVKEGYRAIRPLPEPFEIKMHLYTLRNMLWKAMVRHSTSSR